jgi:hypothetical protein
MVYEHFSKCFIPKDPSSKFSELFQAFVTITCEDIFRSMALVLGASRLLAMAKDIGGLRPIIISEVFFYLSITPLSYNFGGHFRSTYPPINLEYQPLEAMRPSLFVFEPSSTYTLIGP